MEQNAPKNTARWMKILLVVLVISAVGIIYFGRSGISNALDKADLVPMPEKYTELYFNDATSLPASITANEPLRFSFTIHNVEATSTVYPYVVFFEYPNGTKSILVSNTVSLADGASTSITVSRFLQTPGVQGKIVVDLPSLNNQEIDFLLSNNNQ